MYGHGARRSRSTQQSLIGQERAMAKEITPPLAIQDSLNDKLVIHAALLFPFVSFVVHDSPGMMLIGMAMLKLGVITAERDRKFYLLMILLGYGIGGTINAITGYYFASSGFDLGKESLAWRLASEPGRLLVAGGHIGLVMLIVSPIWLRHFRFGPMEWVWRSLTYWRKQPMKIAI